MISRRKCLQIVMGAGFGAALGKPEVLFGAASLSRPNVLLITVDDMSYDTPGFCGGKIPGITPNLDRLAAQSLWLANGHVAVAICQPSRQAMMTGRYPHNNGAPGFDPIAHDVPTLQERLGEAGYLNGILSKVEHLQPQARYCWDYLKSHNETGEGRDPALFYEQTKEFLQIAAKKSRPWFLMANSQDPHRPFAGSSDERRMKAGKVAPFPAPSRTYRPDEVDVPGFLDDLPEVREEIAGYASSVRRADDTVGEILRALQESGMEENTIVMFLSDNGMAFPFAKTNCYLASTRTPWLVRWPGHIKPGTVDRKHFVCGVDFLSTVLEAVGLASEKDDDGLSMVPLFEGGNHPGRDRVFTVINTTAGKQPYPMRGIQTLRWGYVYNQWADGRTKFRNESQAGLTWPAMVAAAKTAPAIEKRVEFFLRRAPEELYDLESDPGCRHNLAASPERKSDLSAMRLLMVEEMARTRDPLLASFRKLILGEG